MVNLELHCFCTNTNMYRNHKVVGVERFTPSTPIAIPNVIPPLSTTPIRPMKWPKNNERPTAPILERPQFKVYCPCYKCARSDNPSLCFISIIDEHIELHKISRRYHVGKFHTKVIANYH